MYHYRVWYPVITVVVPAKATGGNRPHPFSSNQDLLIFTRDAVRRAHTHTLDPAGGHVRIATDVNVRVRFYIFRGRALNRSASELEGNSKKYAKKILKKW